MYELGFLYENGEYVLQNWRVLANGMRKLLRLEVARLRIGLA
jgi:hypothetical protein